MNLPRRPSHWKNADGFTLVEMLITMAIFILLSAAVFEIIAGVFQSTSTLQDNQNHRDQIAALNAFLKKKLRDLPAQDSLISYQRGDGEGLTQNGIIFGDADQATALDAKVQANGYYTLRLTTTTVPPGGGQALPQDARQLLQQAVATSDPSLTWSLLIRDVQTLHWQFQDLNATQWVDLWNNSSAKPNLIEFSMQLAGGAQPVTMDFWLPRLTAVSINVPSTASPTTTSGASGVPTVAPPAPTAPHAPSPK